MNPNELDSLGSSPLHSLVKRDFKKSKKALDFLYMFLTESDVVINLPDRSGNTALHLTVEVTLRPVTTPPSKPPPPPEDPWDYHCS